MYYLEFLAPHYPEWKLHTTDARAPQKQFRHTRQSY